MKAIENRLSTTAINQRQSLSLSGLVKFAKRAILSSAPLTTLARLFSSIIEQEVTPTDVLSILNLFFALCMAVFPVEMPLILRIAAIAWLAKAVSSINSLNLFKED
jgi:hypothetical protein